ncbi:uncharacterized protein [Leptinotarsa decemlineata]|uniref:uncharacterized protein n=1 Tax=Leptinotarsa decemlineata TaxID=7539 RepID=UPI003D30B538
MEVESEERINLAQKGFGKGHEYNRYHANLWNLDVIGIKDVAHIKTKDEHEEKVLKKFIQTIAWKENRYEVHLPWIEGHPEIMRNEEMPNSWLMSTTKKLRNTDKLQEYEKVLHDWETLAIIEEVKQAEKKKVHYSTHHAGQYDHKGEAGF